MRLRMRRGERRGGADILQDQGGFLMFQKNENGGKSDLLHASQDSDPVQRGTDDIISSVVLTGSAWQAVQIFEGDMEHYAGIGVGFVLLLDTRSILARIIEMQWLYRAVS